MQKNSRILVVGCSGMVGSALMRQLYEDGYTSCFGVNRSSFDLKIQSDVEKLFEKYQPEYVFLAAAKVGGILANNTYKAEFIYDNLMIGANVIHAAYKHGVKRLINLGSSCIFPQNSEQPIKEESLFTGALEPTNEPYAIAKIAAIKLCEFYRYQYGCEFISLMPTNLFGRNDNYNLETSHVIAALLRKIHEAKLSNYPTVTIWGTGTPKREFLYVDDLADACVFIMNSGDKKIFKKNIINVGTGYEYSIIELAELIKKVVGYSGDFVYDDSKPDGMVRKIMDSSFIHSLGWRNKMEIKDGLIVTYGQMKEQLENKVRI